MDDVGSTQIKLRLLEPGARQASPAGWRISLGMTEAWVYMLRCRDGSLYTGWTTDLRRRLAQHRAGKASRYTASRLPIELALASPMRDRSAARREEARIKRLDRAGKLALLDHAAQQIQAATNPAG